jgi:hypothetical protein
MARIKLRVQRTGKYLFVEPLRGQGRILLDVSLVVIERAVFPCLQFVGVRYHLHVQTIQRSMVNHVLQHNEAIARQSSNRNLEVALSQASGFKFS